MNEPQQDPVPTLTERLRAAAVARAEARGDVVDGVVLADDGVIDLSVADPAPPTGAGTAPPAALREVRGGSSDVDVSTLYSTDDGPAPRWWQRRRPNGADSSATGRTTTPTMATLPRSDETAPVRDTTPPPEEPVIVPSSASSTAATTPPAPNVDDHTDDSDTDRPTASCPVCEGTARRDLWDRVSGTDYFSCDACHAMWQVPHR